MEENNNNQNREENKNTNNEPIQEVEQEITIEKAKEEEQVQEEKAKFEPIGQTNVKLPKKKKKFKLLLALLVLIAIVGVACWYFFIYTNTKQVYKGLINNLLSITNQDNENISTLKTNVKLDINVEIEQNNEDIDEILKFINNTQADVNIQMDTQQKQLLVKLDSSYENEELLKANMLVDAQKEKTYAQFEQFYDKTLEINMQDEEFYKSIIDIFAQEKIFKEENSQLTVQKILKDELANTIKDEYCNKSKETIKVDSKEVNVDKYELTMTLEQYINELKTTVRNLNNNPEFLDCFENKSDVEDALDEVLSTLKDIEKEINKDDIIHIKLYRQGILQSFVRFEIEVDRNTDNIAIIRTTKVGKTYYINLLGNNKELVSATIKLEEKDKNAAKINMLFDITDLGKIEFNMKSSYVEGENIDTIDTENSVKIDDISNIESIQIFTKLQDSKLYELLDNFIEPFQDNEEDDIDISTNNMNDDFSETTLTEKNQIMTYDGETFVNFEIPEGYEQTYNSDNYKIFNKDKNSVTISSMLGDKEDVLQTVNANIKLYENYNYENLKISQEKTMKINEKTFYYIEIYYESNGEEKYETYITTSLQGGYSYSVQIRGNQKLDDLDINGFLKIEIE